MTPDQKAALEGLVGRSLTDEEVTNIQPLLDVRNDVAIAALLSVGKTKLVPCMVGYGTVMECFAFAGLSGGGFLDAIVALGENDRDVGWAVKLLDRGALDIGRTATRIQVDNLKNLAQFQSAAAGIDALLALGTTADSLNYAQISAALNKAEGRVTL